MGTGGFSEGALDGFSHIFSAPHLEMQKVEVVTLTKEHCEVSG